MNLSRAAVALLLFFAACGDGVQHHRAHGVVRDVNRKDAQVLIEHDEIPGFMSAMTMSFDVPDPELLAGLSQGQSIDFIIAFDGRKLRVVEARVAGDAADRAVSAGPAALAALRTPAPAFALVDQTGSPVSWDALRGNVLLVDFVYTSCPGPCPILTSRHVTLQRELSPELRARTRFVSISLDPVRDTPAVLHAYAEARGVDLEHWSFLTGDPDSVAAVVAGYGVGTIRQEDGNIDHLVATFVVDDGGRIAERFVGLEHETADLRDALERTAGG